MVRREAAVAVNFPQRQWCTSKYNGGWKQGSDVRDGVRFYWAGTVLDREEGGRQDWNEARASGGWGAQVEDY